MYIFAPIPSAQLPMASSSLGNWLVSTRERFGVSQRALARLSGVSQAQISKIEAGIVGSEVKTLDLLVTALAGPDEVEALRREALAASVGLEMESIPDDEELQRRIVAYEGTDPILSAAAATAKGMKEILDRAKPIEPGNGPIAKGRGPRKKWTE